MKLKSGLEWEESFNNKGKVVFYFVRLMVFTVDVVSAIVFVAPPEH